ncbi:MAG: carbamoyltransferase HypF [Candidatus Thermoplasmatota archaeon]|nr:carbamoyltransferase HypF [Candidatus Thermoplasmatota archaeon]
MRSGPHRISVRGVVQGVGFRPTVKRVADSIGARGHVRNDGSHVTIVTDIEPASFMESVSKALGPLARIEGFVSEGTTWASEGYPSPPDKFCIEESAEGARDSLLPPDTAICEHCLAEMLDPDDRRHGHPFTNCTDCGARYSIIGSVPYDRERTTMAPFEMCPECRAEYSGSDARRFHAQTLSCPRDGPLYRFLGPGLEPRSEGHVAIRDAARVIKDGGKVIVKGWGGMHIVCDPERLEDMRSWYGRPHKPFAVMVADIEIASRICDLDREAVSCLESPMRPIVLAKKRIDPPEWAFRGLDLASPGLDSIGIYLPYAGVHYLLFNALKEAGLSHPWMLMTSANVPGEPMGLELSDVASLGADGHLVHDREIASRCDDTVFIPNPIPASEHLSSPGPFGIRGFIIRRSRGIVPMPLSSSHVNRVIGMGAERNLTISLATGGRTYTTPYLGNSRVPSVLDQAVRSLDRFRDLFGPGRCDAVVIDRHPSYTTGRLGREIAMSEGVPLFEVQHHHAHAASLLLDVDLREAGVIVLDGVGFGDDGTPWGAEVLEAQGPRCRRLGHLEPFGLPGGDSAVYHPERIAYWLCSDAGRDLYIGDPGTARTLDSVLSRSIMTTSMGRLLDALSAIVLGVTWRSYDGEPAMRLESVLSRSRSPSRHLFESDIKGGVVCLKNRWAALLEALFGEGDVILPSPKQGLRTDVPDIVMGLVSSILDDLVQVCVDGSPLSHIGISGGVAYDLPIVRSFVSSVRDRGRVPVLHSNVPPGDGGISVGQAEIGGLLLDGK